MVVGDRAARGSEQKGRNLLTGFYGVVMSWWRVKSHSLGKC